MLIDDGESLILTDPWGESEAFGKWLPSPPPFIHPAYLASLAENNNQNFNILISNFNDDHCDDIFLKLFPKNINLIIPKVQSRWPYTRLKNLGFENLIEVNNKEEVSNIKYRTHNNGTISIETEDALIFHCNKAVTFEENDAFTITNHIEDYKCRISHLKKECKIILSLQINTSKGDYPHTYSDFEEEDKEFLTKKINNLFLSIVNMSISKVLIYGGHDNYHTENKNTPVYKDLNFYQSITKPHILNKLNLIDITPGDIYNFNEIKSLFGEYKYTKQNLKIKSKQYYE